MYETKYQNAEANNYSTNTSYDLQNQIYSTVIENSQRQKGDYEN